MGITDVHIMLLHTASFVKIGRMEAVLSLKASMKLRLRVHRETV
jgi:hypothetical protein